MLIEHMAGQIEQIQKQIEEGMHNKVNIEFLQKQLEKLQTTLEKVQEEHRTFKVENGVKY
jgi:enoyl reductase-like protein